MKKVTARKNVIADIFDVLSTTAPKELESLKETDVIRAMTKFAKLTDKFELPEVKAANEEKAALAKAVRAEVKPLFAGKSQEEIKELSAPYDQKLAQGYSDITEKHGLDKLQESEGTVELSDEEHALLLEVLPVVGKPRFTGVKPFAAALEAVQGAVEA